MKRYFLVSFALASSISFAAEVDYSRCTMFAGVQLDHDGKVVPSQFQKIKSQKVEGNKETIVVEIPEFSGRPNSLFEIVLERDSQGRVVKSTTGGERPSAQTLQKYRESMVNVAVMMAPSAGGSFNNKFMNQEPTYWVKKKGIHGVNSGAEGGMVGGSMGGMGIVDPNYEMIPLSKLSKEQAQEVGIENVEELKRLKQQWKKDKKTTEKLRDGYKKVVERSSLVIPLGSEVQFDIMDGVCVPKSMNSRFYNSQSGTVNSIPVSSRERCDKIRVIYERNKAKIVECGGVSNKVNQEYMTEVNGGMVGGFADGGAVGGAVHGSMLAGSAAGGMVTGGMMGGAYLSGGMGGGMYPGMMGGFGMGMYGSPSDLGFVQGQSMMCEYMYEFQSMSPNRATPTQPGNGGNGAQVISQ